MTATTTETTGTDTKATKAPVFDSRGENPERGSAVAIELGMKVKIVTGADKDQGEDGKPLTGVITGIEYQRKRVVVQPDNGSKLIVRPAAKVFVIKNSSGVIQRVERAVRAGKAAKAETPATPAGSEAPAPADA